MSRSGYSDDCDTENPFYMLWPSIVRRSIRGKRGQALLIAMRDALEAMPEKRLIADALERDGEVCALGCLGRARGMDMSKLDPEDRYAVAEAFGISVALVQELTFANDDDLGFRFPRGNTETPEQRYTYMLDWVNQRITAPR